VRSLEAARVYEALGLSVEHTETVETQRVKTAFLPVGDSNLELLEPTSPDSPIAKFIEKRGEGIHHLCFRVDDIEEHLERLKAAGYRLVPESGAWAAFSASRAAYADRLEAMAAFWVAASVSWFGGSDPLRSPTHRPDSQSAPAADEATRQAG